MKIGKLIITTTLQGSNAPLFDKSTTIIREKATGTEIHRGNGLAMLLKPWKRNKYNESLPQKALVIAWCK